MSDVRNSTEDWVTASVSPPISADEKDRWRMFVKHAPADLTIKGVNRNGRWVLFWKFRLKVPKAPTFT